MYALALAAVVAGGDRRSLWGCPKGWRGARPQGWLRCPLRSLRSRKLAGEGCADRCLLMGTTDPSCCDKLGLGFCILF